MMKAVLYAGCGCGGLEADRVERPGFSLLTGSAPRHGYTALTTVL